MNGARLSALLAAGCAAVTLAALPLLGHAKIVCWKDKTGKVVGCGDTVPPEYQDSATKELDKGGITRKTTESAQDAARQRAKSEEAARLKADAERHAAEQKRQDGALLATYSNAQEIDLKRDRDLQVIELQTNQLRTSHKNAVDRQKEIQGRLDVAAKGKKGASDALKDEAARATKEVQRLEQSIAAKDREKDEIRARYAEYHKRYAELTGGAKK
jgi:hypothetical protein